MELDIRQYLEKAKQLQDTEALQSAYRLLRGSAAAGSRGRAPHVSEELYVVCSEAALQLGCLEISTACLKTYFEGNPPADQLLCRAFLCQGQLKSPPATATVEDFEEAVMCFLKAIEISKQEPRYHSLVFNASVLYFQTVRPLLQPGRCLHLVHSLRQVVQSLEEVEDQDYSWRAELMIHLVKCLVDAGEREDAASFAKVTEEFIKSHIPQVYPQLFKIQVQHKLSESGVLLERSRQNSELTVMYKLQELKNRLGEINKNVLTEADSAELEEIFDLLLVRTRMPSAPATSSSPQCPSPMQPPHRVAFLLELALLALQVKHQKVTADCLKELKSVGEASADQRIIMECVNCELNLLKKDAKMSDYSKASVEARLKEVGRLDQWLQTALREGPPQAVQAVCATQWALCLPLLQHNLRKRVKQPLLRLAGALENMQSMFLEMRCHVHSELAVIEEEEGRLEASSTHLRKALLLDNGALRERLSSALRVSELRQTVYQTPSRVEDQALMLMQQIKEMQPEDRANSRPMLVAAGLLLAPDDFQMVLDADDTSQIPEGSAGCGPVAGLAAQAQRHSTCVQKADGHLARPGTDADDTERVNLWATLSKTARKLEVWDVCRAACRFCLLYDDGRWKISKSDKCSCSEGESCTECLPSCSGTRNCVNMLRLLAEIHFISAEATIQKLLAEGVRLNSPAVLPAEPHVPEEDSPWIIYREWIQALSAQATSSFLRAGELGAQIREPWVVANAAIYLWNHNSHVLAAGDHQHLILAFQRVLEMLQNTEHAGNRALFVLLCDAVARGLIQPLSGPDSAEAAPAAPAADKGKSRGEKGMEKAASVHGAFLDPTALQDVRKALELCEHALRLSTCHGPGEAVPLAARKQVLATWVQIKRLLQQQIGSKLDVLKDESESEDESAAMRVLVGVEMFQCNRDPRQMESSTPSLSTLVSMASACSWCDAAVELQVWCQLAASCHRVKEHSLVLSCTQTALQLEEAALRSLGSAACALYSVTAVNELLSTAACLRGQSLVHESRGDLHAYREAMKVLLSSVSFAEKADNPALCATTARHYWNACLPLTHSPEERRQLEEPLETILNALSQTTKHTNKHSKVKSELTSTQQSLHASKQETTREEDSSLRAAIYGLLLNIHTDRGDSASALLLLDKAIRDMPRTRHRLSLLKYRILVKAQRGESIHSDMQKLEDEGELCCSSMWQQVALCASTITQQLACYQKAITSLMSPESRWLKVYVLLEFGQWLYSHNFPTADAQQHVQWAVDILLLLEAEEAEGAEDDSTKRRLSSVECEPPVGVQSSVFSQNVSSLKEVRRLDSLIQAHTLLAVMVGRTSPEHQLNLLRAHTFVLRIWQVSISVACEISSEMAKSQTFHPPPSAGSKKGKDKGKVKKPTPADERPKHVVLDLTVPSTPGEWARYVCPDQVREIFRGSDSPHCINAHSIPKQTQSLFYLNLLEKELHSLSLDYLSLPIMHLAETIAHDLLDRRSLSDLYRLRIVRTCVQLGLETLSPYQEKLVNLSSIQEQEQIECHRALAVSQQRRNLHGGSNQKTDKKAASPPGGPRLHAQEIWLDKAEVCLNLGLYQPARQLLADSLMAAQELGDETSLSRSLVLLARLACQEQNFAQALILLDKAQTLGGDEDFWYQLTLTKVTAVVGQHDHTKVDEIIKQGCAALKLILEQRENRVPELSCLITALEKRGAVECIQAANAIEPGETLSTEAMWRLMAACATLTQCASAFTELSDGEQAAEAHGQCSHALRILASHSTDREEKQRFFMDGLLQLQLAVTAQEGVALNAQSLLPPQEESHGLSLAAVRRLRRLRLALADFSLFMLEELCSQGVRRAVTLQKMTPAERALEEFTRCSPEPNSTEQEWLSVGRTLGQVTLGQLAAVGSGPPDDLETRAHCLSLKGKYLRLSAVQQDPLSACALWDTQKQKDARPDPKAVSKEQENSEEVCGMTSATSSETQRGKEAQQLMTQASKALAEAVHLCLQHSLPPSILADASLNMLECQGRRHPAAAGQYLALFQSCCTVAAMAGVLHSACTDTGASQLAALLSIRRNLLLSQEEKPSSMLKAVENSLTGLSKTFCHLLIHPSHLSILAKLPPNLKVLLLQHSDDGSQLYGAFYETIKASENTKGRNSHISGTLTCSWVAKASVCRRGLLALREQTRAFGLRTHSEGSPDASAEPQTSAEKLAPGFREIVESLEDYLNPLLTQFDFSCLRPAETSLSVPEMTKAKDKEEKGSSAKLPVEAEEYLLILADRMLLELPLESLSIFQEGNLSSVSRDFSLQLFYSRMNRDEPQKVESDNKKETKGGKGTKAKGDQTQAIKAIPANHSPPSNTIPVDTRNFKYIVDPHSKGRFGESSLSVVMKEILETHSQHSTHQWEGFIVAKQKPSLSEVEQLLCSCSAFIYAGLETLLTNVPPAKLAAFNLSGCCMALLFDRIQNKARFLHHSTADLQKSSAQAALDRPVETALLLSLAGVGCVVLNQWHGSLQQNTQTTAAVLDNVLSGRQTSGQAVHTLRKRDTSDKARHTIAGSNDQLFCIGSEEDGVEQTTIPSPATLNCVLYGLPNFMFI
ncbi:cilia- and flagella-associated protein 46 [Salarias fasciatus]|uniref:cilia- and flagella-associated protein 46 n=1 Tax=Salarias fasciatus TaxID=181472 RepID=UPI0011765488|nr:cilia- and flagella-associated protein 46 [Salarias fasciatus]